MEWAPFRGTLPPLNDAEWQRLFDLYRQIPQYALVNEGFGLAGFKQIFWLEWIHRLWGRLIGLAFIGPLIWFWATGRIERRTALLRSRCCSCLAALQGLVGWIMVASGFLPDSTAVSPYRLVVTPGARPAAVLRAGLDRHDRPAAGACRIAGPGRLRALAVICLRNVALTIADRRLRRRDPRRPRLQQLSADGRTARARRVMHVCSLCCATSPRTSQRCSSIIGCWQR